MHLSEYGLRVGSFLCGLAKSDGIRIVVPALDVKAAVGLRVHSKCGSLRLRDGALFRLDNGIATVETKVRFRATFGGGIAGGRNCRNMPVRERARGGRDRDGGPNNNRGDGK